MESLTIFGGRGFVGSRYVRDYYDAAVANIASVNRRNDYNVYSKDVLYFISTVHNFHIFTDPYIDINTNLTLLIEVLENWRARPDSKQGVFNFVSSWLVYGNQENPNGVSETACCLPSGFYSITKRAAEQMLISFCETYGLKYRILRLCNVIGPGDDKVSAQKNGLQYMVNKLANNESVEIYGDGLFFRDYIHVEDCARAIDLVITRGLINHIYNIGNGKTWCFKDIIEFAKKELKSEGSITHVEPKEFQKQVVVRSFFMDNTKLRNLGYTPRYTYSDLFKTLTQR